VSWSTGALAYTVAVEARPSSPRPNRKADLAGSTPQRSNARWTAGEQ
jgi:hypothetical protein